MIAGTRVMHVCYAVKSTPPNSFCVVLVLLTRTTVQMYRPAEGQKCVFSTISVTFVVWLELADLVFCYLICRDGFHVVWLVWLVG